MIPVLAGVAIGTVFAAGWGVASGGAAGMSYALGRKYGRLICEQLDRLEDRSRHIITIDSE
mgnify:FL=1|jgi:hypothetical protein